MKEKATAEFEIQASEWEDVFYRIPASELSLDDEFMKHEPRRRTERRFKLMLEHAIRRGMKDFWCPKYPPSFNKDGTGIYYVPSNEPAVGKSYNWWENTAKQVNPRCKSRLCRKSEYITLLAVLIKKLAQIGWSISDAWHVVCSNSDKLRDYLELYNDKCTHGENSDREIISHIIYILSTNTYIILAEDTENGGFWQAAGIDRLQGNYCSLSVVMPYYYENSKDIRESDMILSTGLIILETCP